MTIYAFIFPCHKDLSFTFTIMQFNSISMVNVFSSAQILMDAFC